ncbi:hypothetical protein H2248_010143 [Termitomyces sp. 'cryptogamus']|nr:hypothetical protein H2248_010143 [Termitomyces sp. 'cryptogamus']
MAYEVVKKILQELVTAGEKHRESSIADSARALQETAELRNAVKDLTKAVDTLVKRQEGDPMQKGPNRSYPTGIQGVKTVIATGPTYRPTRSSNPNQSQSTKRQQTPSRSPKDQYHLVVIPRGEKFDTNYLNPRRLVNLINDRLSLSPTAKHLCVASAQYNYNQNLCGKYEARIRLLTMSST